MEKLHMVSTKTVQYGVMKWFVQKPFTHVEFELMSTSSFGYTRGIDKANNHEGHLRNSTSRVTSTISVEGFASVQSICFSEYFPPFHETRNFVMFLWFARNFVVVGISLIQLLHLKWVRLGWGCVMPAVRTEGSFPGEMHRLWFCLLQELRHMKCAT